MAGSNLVWNNTLLSSSPKPKPLSFGDHHTPLQPLHHCHVLAPPFQVEKIREKFTPCTMPATMALERPEPLLSPTPCQLASLVHKDTACARPSLPLHARSQNARVQYLTTACQTRGERAPAPSWTRQNACVSGRPRPPLALPSCTHHHHTTSYLLDMLTSSRTLSHRRHDQRTAAPVLHGHHHRQLATDHHWTRQHAH
jgi:hypothetical protein